MANDTTIPYRAAADLSSKQHHCLKDNGSGAAAAITAATDYPIGILQNAPSAADDVCTLATEGVVLAKLGGTVAKGDPVGPDATGKLVKRGVGASGGWVIGRAGAAGVDGDLIGVRLAPVPMPVSPTVWNITAEQTGTGSPQNIPHYLGIVPYKVLCIATEHPGTPDTGAFDVAQGSHDATNVVVTVTANVKFQVFAIA